MKASLPYGLLLLLLGLILAVLVVFALGQGAYPLSGTEVLRALAAGFGNDPEAGQNQAVRVVWDLRLPRIAAALLVGAALSTAGAAYQTMFRNPLVSPDILGVSSGAGLGGDSGHLFEFLLVRRTDGGLCRRPAGGGHCLESGAHVAPSSTYPDTGSGGDGGWHLAGCSLVADQDPG